MTHLERALLEQLADLGRELQQAQEIRDTGTRAAVPPVPVRIRLPPETFTGLNVNPPTGVIVSTPVAGSNVPVPAGRIVTELKFPLALAALNSWNWTPPVRALDPILVTTNDPA